MKHGSLAAGAVSAATVVALAVWVDADGTAGGDVGAPAESRKATQGCVGGRPGSTGPAGAREDSPLYRTLDRIGDLAAGRHSGVFTGLSVDEDGNAADVWRIPSTAFEEAVCEAAEQGVHVRFHDSDTNRRDLDALAERIGEDMGRWDGTFQMREVGVDERGYVRIGVDDPGTARPLIEREFGAEHIRVERAEPAGLD